MTGQLNTYFLADAARINTAFEKLRSLNDTCLCLYQGKSEQNLAVVAPYIFAFPHRVQFAEQVIKKGWKSSWGVYVVTPVTIEEARHHFRKFLFVNTEDDRELYFRFYDPRVMRIFLPTCDEEQLKEFFGPVTAYICEDEDPAIALRFTFDGRQLLTEKISADTFAATIKTTQSNNNTSTEENNSKGQPQKKPPRKFIY